MLSHLKTSVKDLSFLWLSKYTYKPLELLSMEKQSHNLTISLPLTLEIIAKKVKKCKFIMIKRIKEGMSINIILQ